MAVDLSAVFQADYDVSACKSLRCPIPGNAFGLQPGMNGPGARE